MREPDHDSPEMRPASCHRVAVALTAFHLIADTVTAGPVCAGAGRAMVATSAGVGAQAIIGRQAFIAPGLQFLRSFSSRAWEQFALFGDAARIVGDFPRRNAAGKLETMLAFGSSIDAWLGRRSRTADYSLPELMRELGKIVKQAGVLEISVSGDVGPSQKGYARLKPPRWTFFAVGVPITRAGVTWEAGCKELENFLKTGYGSHPVSPGKFRPARSFALLENRPAPVWEPRKLTILIDSDEIYRAWNQRQSVATRLCYPAFLPVLRELGGLYQYLKRELIRRQRWTAEHFYSPGNRFELVSNGPARDGEKEDELTYRAEVLHSIGMDRRPGRPAYILSAHRGYDPSPFFQARTEKPERLLAYAAMLLTLTRVSKLPPSRTPPTGNPVIWTIGRPPASADLRRSS